MIERGRDIGLRVLGNDAREPCDQRAPGVDRDASREIECVFAPVGARTIRLGSFHHGRVVC